MDLLWITTDYHHCFIFGNHDNNLLLFLFIFPHFRNIFHWCFAPIGRSLMLYSLKDSLTNGLSNTKRIFQIEPVVPEIVEFNPKNLFNFIIIYRFIKVFYTIFMPAEPFTIFNSQMISFPHWCPLKFYTISVVVGLFTIIFFCWKIYFYLIIWSFVWTVRAQ